MTHASNFQVFKLRPMAPSCLFRIASPRWEFCPFGNLPCVSEGQRFIKCSSDLCHSTTLHTPTNTRLPGVADAPGRAGCRWQQLEAQRLPPARRARSGEHAVGASRPAPCSTAVHRQPESPPFPKTTTAEMPFRTAPGTSRYLNPRGTASCEGR